ncbi:MAG: formylglycine-generating enzyme family protein [Alphaproteobacteria bacterium]|nr:formylglycine-generating enzyme family protein [Alphaproteobacteria bacterium]
MMLRSFREILISAVTVGVLTTVSAQTSPAGAVGSMYVIRSAEWSDADERDYSAFILGIGRSGCNTVDACLKSPGNPFRNTDSPTVRFYSDCAQLPYVLRAYFAWKRGLPFSYQSGAAARGASSDIRYSQGGNQVTARTDVLTGSIDGYKLLRALGPAVSTATYRVHPHLETPREPDFYSPAIRVNSIRPGTIIYDPDGHVAVIYEVQHDGRAEYMDSHPDNSVTRGTYDLRFVRAAPAVGAGFKNWRPSRLVGYSRREDGALVGGHVVLARNSEIADYSDEQFFGNGDRPADPDWANGTFTLNGEQLDYYDYVRAMLAGGTLEMHPVSELTNMIREKCTDMQDRATAVQLAIQAGIQNRPEPGRLPRNIYGTSGDWETYSTPSRDARLKTAFKEVRDNVARFVTMYRTNNKHLVYNGNDLVADLQNTYDQETARCSVTYTRTDGSPITLPYEEVRKRLFRLSFDPYQCVERRWGAADPNELSTCRDDANKQAWYAAEQNLRNQINRTYDARMDFSLADLQTPGPGKGVANPPDVDVRSYLARMRGVTRGSGVADNSLTGAQTATAQTDPAAWRAKREAEFSAWQQNRSDSEIWDAPDAPKLVAIRGGTFAMGSPPGEIGRWPSEGPQHRVTIGRDFAVGKFAVTFDEWGACVAAGSCRGYRPPDEHWGRGSNPVINVSWQDAQAYLSWLSAKTGHRYRLLTEAEFEYAERAGTQSTFATGNSITTSQANFMDPATMAQGTGLQGRVPMPVGSFPPNNFGLYDMQGNVWEWVEDCWHDSYAGAPGNGSAWLTGDCQRRVVRGGGFNREAKFMRSASRYWIVADIRSPLAGFRVARELD